jgi:hypothetical protein
MFQRRNGVLSSLLVLGLVCAAGCSTPTVSGKVTLKKDGSPVSLGTMVTFWGGDNQSATTQTAGDGTYVLPGAPLGEVTVTVTGPSVGTQALNSARPPGDKTPVPTIVPIPKDYGDKAKTPVKYTVQKGSQEFNIPIE